MTSKFSLLIDMLTEAFTTPISEMDYHSIVKCLRHYDTNRESQETECKVLRENRWPVTYHPCDHMENIRFGMCMGAVRNRHISHLIRIYYT